MITTNKIIDDTLLAQIRAAGESVWIVDGVVQSTNDVVVQAIIDAYDPLPAIRQRVWHAIQAKRDALKNTPVLVSGNRFHSDLESRMQQFVLATKGVPQGLHWKCVGDTYVLMTDELANAIVEATAAREQVIFAAAEVHRLAMLQAIDPASYDFSAGWPEV